MPFTKPDIKTLTFAYDVMDDWMRIDGWVIKNYGVLVAIAIEHYDKMLKRMSEKEIDEIMKKNQILIHKWQKEGLMHKRARNVGGYFDEKVAPKI